jgi:hypothetical protein
MKKQLFLGLMMIFFIGTSLFAGISEPLDSKDKTTGRDTKENKLSGEELSRMTRRAETNNLPTGNFMKNENSDSKNNLKPSKQVVVEGRHRHGYILYGGGTVILIIILILLLA